MIGRSLLASRNWEVSVMKMNHVRFVDDHSRYSKYIRSWLVMAIYGNQWLITPVMRVIHSYLYIYVYICIYILL